jgi:hypothetical protein
MIENTATALERAEAVLEKYGKSRQSAAQRQRLVPRAQQRVGLTDRRARQARQEIRHAAADPRLLLLFDPRFQHRPRLALPRSSGWSISACSTSDAGRAFGWLEPQEVAMLVKRKPSLVCAPSSSLHNGYGNFVVGKLPELIALGVNVAVGSDHASSASST